MKSKCFEPIQEIASNRAGELSRAMADAARAEFEKRRLLWSEKRVEAESLGRVVERFRKEGRHAADRREQHDADAATLRISLGTRRDTGHWRV